MGFNAPAPPIVPIGLVVISPAALERLALYDVRAADVIARHARCEWPDMTRAERDANILALNRYGRVEGKYILRGPPCASVVIVSELVRRVTYVLLPGEAGALLDIVLIDDLTVMLRPPA